MAPEYEIDQVVVTQQLDDLQITREIAMEALDSVIAKMHSALEYSADRYEKLYTKYRELEDTVANNAMYVTKQVEDVPGYILAIIDAHSHNFMDPFLKGASDDGAAAAKRVEEIITEILKRDRPDLAGVHVLIRVYADVQLLTSQLDAAEGDEAKHSHSLVPFAQDFSSGRLFADFVNVSHSSKMAEKMKGIFQWHMQDPRCKHILFNIAEDSSIYNMLEANTKYKRRTTDIPEALARILPDYVATKTINSSSSTSNIERSGSDEKAAHEGRERSQDRKTYGYFENNGYIPVVSLDTHEGPSIPSRRLNESTSRHRDAPPAQADQIPINAAGHRLDPLLRMPSLKERADFKSRTKSSGLCTPFHIRGYCHVKDCRYDHGHTTPAHIHVLRHKLMEWPCHFKGKCRIKDCYHGHTCVARGCRSYKYKGCRFGSEAHSVDKEVHEWVKPGSQPDGRSEERSDNESAPTAGVCKGSMEDWPTMVTDLIEI